MSGEHFWTEADNRESVLVLKSTAPHPQVLPFFPEYDTNKPSPGTVLDYRDPQNAVGHAQRAFVIYWALRGFTELGFAPGIDIGGAGVPTPGCISVDIVGTGETPAYGGSYDGVHIKADGGALAGFGENCFSSIVSSHVGEHFPCDRCPTEIDWKIKKRINCPGEEIIHIVAEVWHRVLRPNGYLAAILPDEDCFEPGSLLAIDPTHNHAYRSSTFYDMVIARMLDRFDCVQYNTLKNNFSFDFVLRKK